MEEILHHLRFLLTLEMVRLTTNLNWNLGIFHQHSSTDINSIWVVVLNMFYFHPYLEKWSNLTNIFQMGWNHQLGMFFFLRSTPSALFSPCLFSRLFWQNPCISGDAQPAFAKSRVLSHEKTGRNCQRCHFVNKKYIIMNHNRSTGYSGWVWNLKTNIFLKPGWIWLHNQFMSRNLTNLCFPT